MPKISVKLVVLLISLSLLQSGCGIMKIIDAIERLDDYATFETSSYRQSDDADCSSETYEDDTCTEAINPFPDRFVLNITEATLDTDLTVYTLHNDSMFKIINSSDELLYETDIVQDMNSDKDYGFIIEQGGYLCTSISRYSYADSEDSYKVGEYVTTNCVNNEDTADSCHLCYNLLETLGTNITSQQNP